MIRIPNKKEFVTISVVDQRLRHWNVDFPPANKFNPPALLRETLIKPADNSFVCISALTDIDTSIKVIWATGFYSKYFLEYNFQSGTANFHEIN